VGGKKEGRVETGGTALGKTVPLKREEERCVIKKRIRRDEVDPNSSEDRKTKLD